MATEDERTFDEITAEPLGSDGESPGRGGNSILKFLSTHTKWVQIGIWTVVILSTAVVAVCIALSPRSPDGFLHISDVGYLATFYLNLIGSATIILPLPGVLSVCVAAEPSLGLNLVLIGLIGAAGATLGETVAYLAGYAGHNAVTNLRWYTRIHDLMERRGGITLFFVSFIPTPFFDLAGIAAGALNYPFQKFILYVFTGKAVRLIVMAYACRQGIDWLRSIFEFKLPLT